MARFQRAGLAGYVRWRGRQGRGADLRDLRGRREPRLEPERKQHADGHVPPRIKVQPGKAPTREFSGSSLHGQSDTPGRGGSRGLPQRRPEPSLSRPSH